MAKAEFSYEVRKLPTDPVWIEDYVVRSSDGESVGTVAAVLEHEGERLVVVERGVVPLAQDRRVVPWHDVERVDHDALAVWLTLDERTFAERALELDPDRAVEEGDAEATRVRETPPGEVPPAQTAASGPVDRPLNRLAILAGGLAAFSLLVVAVAVTATGEAWPALFGVVPLGLGILAAVLAYRAYRNPYEPRGARKL
jgi:hypothetical protein